MYENVIIGGGIAGLIIVRELLQSSQEKMLLLEASNNLGGKIKTIFSNNGTVKYESGPWTVSYTHLTLPTKA